MFNRRKVIGYLNAWASTLLALLWFYAASAKLLDTDQFASAMRKQAFGPLINTFLIAILPPLEILTGAALLSKKFKSPGLWLSLVMLMLFTVYILLIRVGVFRHVPCACGGIISNIGWNTHLYLNLAFLTINLYSIITQKRKEPGDTK